MSVHPAAVALGGSLLLAAAAVADDAPGRTARREKGAALYREHCIRCHGEGGRGDGPLADTLRFRPADLTLLSRGAGGRFPAARVARTIDGRRPLPGHGGPEMPVWGDLFRSAENDYDEGAAQEAIAALVAYLETLQRPRAR
jgi:mono/diheme cytochrome c family protein